MGPPILLSPQSVVDTAHHFLFTQLEISEEQKIRIKALNDGVVLSLVAQGSRQLPALWGPSEPLFVISVPQIIASVSADKIPFLHLKRRMGTWGDCSDVIRVYFDILRWVPFSCVTHVVVTTSRYGRVTFEYYQGI